MMARVEATKVPSEQPGWDVFVDWMGVIRDLEGLSELLEWDQETAMPPGGAEGRSHVAGTVAALLHRELVRDDIGDILEALPDGQHVDDDERAMVRQARRDRGRALRVPEDLARAESELASRCTSVWRDARDAGDYAMFAAALRPLVAVKRQIAHALAGGGDPYDAFLEEFEPGARSSELTLLFDDLCARLAPIVRAASMHDPEPLPDDHWAEGGQAELARSIATMLGFDLDAGAIGISAHPFTSMHHAGDVRFSTTIDPKNPTTNVLVVLHEAGHAIYEQGLPQRHARTSLYAHPSMGVHESQSRFYEMHIGCTDTFWHRLEPELGRLFPDQLARCDVDRIAATTRRVQPGALRLEADEVTYNLHIAVRFRLEARLIRGELEVDDLPAAWSDEMQALLGVRPEGDRDGVLQDIHWAVGMFGYFPTYTLGNIYAAQLRLAMERELGPLDDLLQRGDFMAIRGFMRERIHSHGRRYSAKELMEAATGEPLSADALVAHLERRYLPT
jgi:carboxypeptidase Taq